MSAGAWAASRRDRRADRPGATDSPAAASVLPVLPRGNRPRPRAQGRGAARHRVGGAVPDGAAVRARQPPAARDVEGGAIDRAQRRRSRPCPGSLPTAGARRRSPRVTRCSGSPRALPVTTWQATRLERRPRARDRGRHPRRGAAAPGIVASVRRLADSAMRYCHRPTFNAAMADDRRRTRQFSADPPILR